MQLHLQLTMQSHQDSDSPPDPPSPRMSCDAKYERKRGDNSKAHPELRYIPGSRPSDAKVPVLLLAAVGFASREGSAFVVRVFDLAAV